MKHFMVAILVLLAAPALAFASNVTPTSYDTPNGYSGSYNYWDDTYSGAGSTTTNGAFLSGGLGDLTDGILASDNWNVTEAPAGAGPYVGWTINPTITFHFASAVDFQAVRVHFDDANGYGGVSAPAGVKINGTDYSIADPAGSAPFLAEFDISSFSPTDTLSIELLRSNTWVFASEVQFEAAAPVPLPGAMLLFGSGIAGLAGVGLRRKKK